MSNPNPEIETVEAPPNQEITDDPLENCPLAVPSDLLGAVDTQMSKEPSISLSVSYGTESPSLNGPLSGENQAVTPVSGPVTMTTQNPKVLSFKEKLLESDRFTTPPLADGDFFENNVMIEFGEHGRPSITISQEAMDCLAKGWSNSFVIKLLGRSIAFHTLKRKLKELWEISGKFVIVDLTNGYSMVQNWSPKFHPIRDTIKTICSWVHLIDLPMIFYEERVLRCIRSSLGRPVRVDKNTLHAMRGKFARIYVEIDLSKPLQRVIIIKGEQIVVEYEGLGDIYITCGREGHLVNRCPEIPSSST
ncbi:hypothetical protein V2J09_008045 [Rumex salicifolius]